MTNVTHHLTDALLCAYAAGNLPQSFSLVVASHVSMCLDCRARLEAEEAAGGAVLESLSPRFEGQDARLLDAALARLDDPVPDTPVYPRSRVYPGPVMTALKGRQPGWRSLGNGIRQAILCGDDEGSARLLFIPPGRAVPDHGHNGLEMTLVLQGEFSDETGRYGVGDVEVADAALDHTPVAGAGDPCICLAATDAPLRFHALIPRLLQPVFRI